MDSTPDGVLAALKDLSAELDLPVVSIAVKLKADILGNLIETFVLQLEYERMRRYEGIDPIDFLETAGALLGEMDAMVVREAQEVHRQIMEKLSNSRTPKSGGGRH